MFLIEECLYSDAADIVIISWQELPGSTGCTSSGRKVHWGLSKVEYGKTVRARQ